MNHVVLAYPFLLLAFFYVLSKLSGSKTIRALILVFIAINIGPYTHLTRLSYHDFTSPALGKINKVVNERFADRYVCVVLEGYAFDMKVLYGNRNQCVLLLKPAFTEAEITDIRKIMTHLKRKALFIDAADDNVGLPRLRKEFPNMVRLSMDFDPGIWEVWYEK